MAIRRQGDVYVVREAIPGESMVFGGADPSVMKKRYEELLAKNEATAPALFEKGASINPKAIAIREMIETGYRDISFEEMISWCKSFARVLYEGNLCPEKTEFSGKKLRYLGTYMYNRPEQVLCEIGGLFMGAVNVALYEEPHEHGVYMVNNLLFDTIVLQPNYAKQLAKLMKEKTIRHVNNFILTEEMDEETKAAVQEQGINIYYLNDMITKGKELKTELPKIQPDDIFLMPVTSGSTGYPKTVVLSQKSFAYLYLGVHPFRITSQDVMVMNLNYPFISCKGLAMITLAHGGQTVFYPRDHPLFYYCQPAIGYKMMKRGNPTFTFFNPLYLHGLHQLMLDEIRKMPEHDGLLTKKAIEEKIKLMKEKHELHFPEQDKYIQPLHDIFFGPNLNQTYYVGAKVREDSLWFIRAVLGCTLQSTYGQTELACLSSTDSPFGEYGRIGTAQSGALVKIVDCPSKGFTTKDVIDGKLTPRGELCIQSPTSFLGYLNDPEKTKEAYLPGGWLRTNDIVELDMETMVMKIIGRANEVVKLSNEEFVPVEPLEKIYETSKYVYQIYMHASFEKDFVVAVVVPKRGAVMEWAKAKGLVEDFEELCKGPELLSLILDDLHALAAEKKLASYVYIKRAYIFPKPFDTDPEMVTYTGKIRRAGIAARFKDIIESMSKK